ncbi:Alpha/Beta hydrolase protein [Rhexocercosporidium sp. MPI-PUGE-AT-0058]|nr:Alpha/Beta hydrolase protein [Rhexocercosporidium sp. MPI-PUGE-AT-0058]
MAEYRHLATPQSQWVDYPNNLPPETKIGRMKRERDPIIPHLGLDIVELPVKSRGIHEITIRSYIPKKESGLPLIVYMHGGGFVFGGLENDDSACRELAYTLRVSVVNIEYRLAPENPFPCGLNDCQDVLRRTTTQDGKERLRTDLERGFVLGGTSAGGNFTAVLAHEAVIEGMSPPLTGLLFMASSFCHPDVRPEKYKDRILGVDEIHNALGLTRKSIDHFAGKYGAPPADVRLSPLLYTFHDRLAQKAYFQICGWDPRRDEALLYDEILRENGIDTRKDVYPGLPMGGGPQHRSWNVVNNG